MGELQTVQFRALQIEAEGCVLTFRVADPEHALAGVRLQPDLRMPADLLEFRRAGDSWELELAQPPLSRLEYLLELRYPGGGSKVIADPGNPLSAPGAFGPKSVLEFPGYAPPPGCPGPPTQERRFPYFRRITDFTAAVHAGGLPDGPVPVVLTCGAIEENIENNRLMLATLRSRGYAASLHEVADMHNYTAWRDAFDPHLTALLKQVCG